MGETMRKTEQAKQARLWADIEDYGVKAVQARAAYYRSIKLMWKAEQEQQVNWAKCRQLRIVFRNRQTVRHEELGNIDRLKSLLKVLIGTSTPPKCEGEMKGCSAASQGQCVFKRDGPKGIGKCVCEWTHYGLACQNKRCPGTDSTQLYRHDEFEACNGSGRGTCDRATGKCSCKDGFRGDKKHGSCQFVTRCPSGNCSNGQGNCDKYTGKCTCKANRFGKGCEHRKCPGDAPRQMLFSDVEEEVCYGHGICNGKTGRCTCFKGWRGYRCDQKDCPDECSSRGTCDHSKGKCLCNAGYHGLSCEWKTCPAQCGGLSSGECDRDSGKCVCKAGYSGRACGKSTTCDSKATTYRQWSMFRQGWSKCPYGWLMTGVKTGGCSSIECLQRARCARPCIEGTRLALGDCYQANWWMALNKRGYSKCRDPYFLAGLYRNKCNSLYCIEVGYCCTVRKASYSQCGEHTWTAQITKLHSWAHVPANRFITGLWRKGKDATVHDLQRALFCNFVIED